MSRNRYITVLNLAIARGAKIGENGVSGSEFDRLNLPFMGGCQRCGAMLHAGNMHPTKNGYITGSCCIEGDDGFDSVPQYDEYEREEARKEKEEEEELHRMMELEMAESRREYAEEQERLDMYRAMYDEAAHYRCEL